MPLDPDSLGILRFEKQPWRSATAKTQAIAEQFGLTPTRYYQRLNQLVDSPAALAAEPVLVNRLRRIRDERSVRIHSRPAAHRG